MRLFLLFIIQAVKQTSPKYPNHLRNYKTPVNFQTIGRKRLLILLTHPSTGAKPPQNRPIHFSYLNICYPENITGRVWRLERSSTACHGSRIRNSFTRFITSWLLSDTSRFTVTVLTIISRLYSQSVKFYRFYSHMVTYTHNL